MQRRGEAVIVGRVVGVYGVKGWFRLESYTDPRENIEQYSPWLLQAGEDRAPFRPEALRRQGKGLIAKLEGIDDRDEAARWVGRAIAVSPGQLPPLEEGEFYWHELIGLKVINRAGEALGTVDSLIETGANDVLVVEGEAGSVLIPYVPGRFIDAVDTARGEIRVDWHREWGGE